MTPDEPATPPAPAPQADPAAVGQAAGQAAAQAGATAGQTRETVAAAAPSLSDADVDRIAQRITDKQIAELERRGAFTEPEPATPANEPANPEPEAEPPPEPEPPAPRRRSFAERFMGRED